MEARGEPVGAGTGMIERRAIMQARVKAQLVKYPKVVWRRLRALCIVVKERQSLEDIRLVQVQEADISSSARVLSLLS
jgi:hypothetical protein